MSCDMPISHVSKSKSKIAGDRYLYLSLTEGHVSHARPAKGATFISELLRLINGNARALIINGNKNETSRWTASV